MSRWLVLILSLATTAFGAEGGQDVVVMSNSVVSLSINKQGGAISSFMLNEQGLNPYSWKAADQAWSESRKEGLFTCFDRVGFPSKQMQDAGIPFHGEATSVIWEVLEQSVKPDGCCVLKMRCQLPVAKMTLTRTYELYPNSSVCRVSDQIRNDNPFAKPYNILMHPSIGAPFLDPSVLVDCNALDGFLKGAPLSQLEEHVIQWPNAVVDQKQIDLSRMTNGVRVVANFITDEELGWGCVSSPNKGIMTGCLWETADYPWFRVWREWKEGAPTALGIEFSTTPLGKPLDEVRAVGDLLGRPTIERLGPGTETTKTFYMFLAKIPDDYTGVKHVTLSESGIRIDEKGPREHPAIVLDVSE